MFNIGWTELLLIAIVFLIFIKPKDFPFFIKNIANFFGLRFFGLAACQTH